MADFQTVSDVIVYHVLLNKNKFLRDELFITPIARSGPINQIGYVSSIYKYFRMFIRYYQASFM